jgi:hypothetical protein
VGRLAYIRSLVLQRSGRGLFVFLHLHLHRHAAPQHVDTLRAHRVTAHRGHPRGSKRAIYAGSCKRTSMRRLPLSRPTWRPQRQYTLATRAMLPSALSVSQLLVTRCIESDPSFRVLQALPSSERSLLLEGGPSSLAQSPHDPKRSGNLRLRC